MIISNTTESGLSRLVKGFLNIIYSDTNFLPKKIGLIIFLNLKTPCTSLFFHTSVNVIFLFVCLGGLGGPGMAGYVCLLFGYYAATLKKGFSWTGRIRSVCITLERKRTIPCLRALRVSELQDDLSSNPTHCHVYQTGSTIFYKSSITNV